jgi:hypothetical protein
VNCSNLSFDQYYSHIEAHHDDHGDYLSLTPPLQLNCSMDYLAKKAMWDLQVTQPPSQQAFPLEPICIYASSTKITADMGDYGPFWTHHQLAWERFQSLKILPNQEFDYVDWEMVYEKQQDVSRLFQVWACKQVMGAAGTMEWDKTTVRTCPSCMVARDTCTHVLFCFHKGRVEMF